MSKRKILILALSLCMVAILAVGGTLAYFTDTEQATNTMVIGNVEINIEEFTYEDGKWAPFADDAFTLYPIENAKGFKDIKNKIVYTFNTSKSQDDAYIRTIILFEKNDVLDATYKPEADCCVPGLHFAFHQDSAPQTSSSDGKTYYGSTNTVLPNTVTIKGNEYWVVAFTEATGTAIPYDAALYTISGVWMDKNITSEQIKGWGEDGKVDIIVFSQGIQSYGLTHEEAMAALGEVNATNLQSWIKAEDDAVINNWTDKK